MKKWSELPNLSSILVVAPHPDDEIIACGGVMRHLLKKGSKVAVVYITGNDIRKTEATRAMHYLGSSDLFFLNHPDGNVDRTKIAKGILSVVEACTPEVIFAPSEKDFHKDHSETGIGVMKAVKNIPVWTYNIWGSPCSESTIFYDISPLFEKKLKALRRHFSQMRDFDLVGLCRSHNHYTYLVNGGKRVDGYAESFVC